MELQFWIVLEWLPGGNEVSKYEEPSGEGVRVDAALYAGGKPSMHYVLSGMSSKLQLQWPVCPESAKRVGCASCHAPCQDPLVGKLICYAPGQGNASCACSDPKVTIGTIATFMPNGANYVDESAFCIICIDLSHCVDL